MKVSVLVRLKPEVLDPQGDAVRHALDKIGLTGVKDVRIGKLIEIEMSDSKIDPKELKKRIESMADALLANPVIEDYAIEM